MNCRNCHTSISEQDSFCLSCGAKVVTERITFRLMVSDFFQSIFGWDNRYFSTLRDLTIRPEKVVTEYIQGTRKRYMNPFSYFAIATAISLLCFTSLSEDFFAASTSITQASEQSGYEVGQVFQKKLSSTTAKPVENEIRTEAELREAEERKKKAQNFQKQIPGFILKYYNLISFLSLPLYALLAFWVFGKPYNYGEHATINAYLQGHGSLASVIMLGVGVLLDNPSLYLHSMIIMVIYYVFVYQRLYRYKLLKLVWKVIKFFLILFLLGIVLMLIGVVVAIISNKHLIQ